MKAKLKVKVKKLDSCYSLPKYATDNSAGLDLYASQDEILNIGDIRLIQTGIAIKLPEGCMGLVCSRSGLALKNGIFVLNSPGIVDFDFRGPIGVILANFGSETFVVKKGDRIAQLVITEFKSIEWEEQEKLDDTDRGEGGFGSTGVR